MNTVDNVDLMRIALRSSGRRFTKAGGKISRLQIVRDYGCSIRLNQLLRIGTASLKFQAARRPVRFWKCICAFDPQGANNVLRAFVDMEAHLDVASLVEDRRGHVSASVTI